MRMSTGTKQVGLWIRTHLLRTRPERRSEALHIVGLSALAFAQPTFDILSRNGTFFVAHRSTRTDIFVLVSLLVAGIPLVLIALTRAIGAFSATGYRIVLSLVIFLLAGFAAAPPIARALDLSSLGWTLAFLTAGSLIAFVYSRRRHFSRGITVLSAAAPVFCILIFLTSATVRQIMFPSTVGTISSTAVRDTPVVIVLFDGLSLGSLLTPEGEVNNARYPNFGELADSSTWYQGVSTVGQSTFHAVPALLTGRRPRPGKVPNARDHPQNLFVALGSSYQMNVREWVTQLCPPSVCKEREPVQRSILLEDSAIVLGHMVLPRELAKVSLPPIDDQWAGFGRTSSPIRQKGSSRKSQSNADTRREMGWTGREQIVTRFEELLDQIERPSRSLWFTHIGIPHAPWQFLQTRQSYLPKAHPRVPGIEDGTWTKNRLLVAQGLQRYLLQVKASDALLGAVIDRLKKTKSWNDALLIVTADHGTAFIPGRPTRVMDDRSAAQLLPVPLFIKYPGQKEGSTDKRFAELVDVMPTILDVLQLDVPWKLDGTSLRGPEHARPSRRVYLGRLGFRDFDPEFKGIDEISRRIHDLFGMGGGQDDLFNFGSRRLVGRRVSAISEQIRQVAVEVDSPEAYRSMEPESTFVPAMLEATVKDKVAPSTPVVVSLNGRVAGMGWSYREGARTRITIMLAPRFFKQGENEVQVFEISRAVRR